MVTRSCLAERLRSAAPGTRRRGRGRPYPAEPVRRRQLPKRKHADRGYLSHAQVAALASCRGAPARSGAVPRLYRLAVGRDGRAAGAGFRHAAPPGQRVALGHRVRRAGVVHAQDARTAVGAVPGRAGRRACGVDGRQGPRCIWCSPICAAEVLRNSNWRARVFAPAVAKCQKADERFRRSRRTTCGIRRPAWRCSAGRQCQSGATDARSCQGSDDPGRVRRFVRHGLRRRCGPTGHCDPICCVPTAYRGI